MQRYEDFKAKYDPNFSFDKKGGAGANKINGLMKIKELMERINNKGDDLDLYLYEIIYNN